MSEKTYSEQINQEACDWSFPDVDELDAEIEEEDFFEEEVHSDEDGNDQADNTQVMHQSIEKTEVEKLQESLALQKLDWNKKIKSVNRILKKIRKPFMILDNDIMLLIQDVIKHIVFRILHKEITFSAENIKVIIDDLSQLIQCKEGLNHIYISPEDFERIYTSESHLEPTIKVDPTLKDGDVIIKSNASEIRGILSERIELLMKVQNE